MNRRIFLPAFLTWLAIGTPAISTEASSPAPKRAAIMDFDLIDEMRDYETADANTAQQRRLILISDE